MVKLLELLATLLLQVFPDPKKSARADYLKWLREAAERKERRRNAPKDPESPATPGEPKV